MPTHFEGPGCQVLALDTMIKLTRATNTLMARLSRRETHGGLTESQFPPDRVLADALQAIPS